MNKQFSEDSPSRIAIKKLFSDKLTLLAIFIILFFLFISLLGPYIRYDKSPKANDQHLELAVKSPGFKVKMLLLRENRISFDQSFPKKLLFGEESDYNEIPIYSYTFEKTSLKVEKYTGDEPNNGEILSYSYADILYALKNQNLQLKGDMLAFEHLEEGLKVMPLSTLKEEVMENNLITKTYYLGTDRYGRDMMSRIMSGTWISFTVGIISILISLIIGISLGALAGYYRGKLDDFIVWIINVVWSIPTLLLVIAITLALGKGFWQVFVAVGLTMWVEVARVVRGQVMSMREKEFVEAGKSLGFSDSRIIFKHILPNVTGPVIVISAANFAAAILIEAGLSFLGLGAQPPQATWGKMISEHKGYIVTGDAYLAIFPGLAIFILVLSFVLLGNGLRDAYDTKGVKNVNI